MQIAKFYFIFKHVFNFNTKRLIEVQHDFDIRYAEHEAKKQQLADENLSGKNKNCCSKRNLSHVYLFFQQNLLILH